MEKATINNPGFKLQIAQLNFFFFLKPVAILFFVLGASFALKPICAGHGSAASFCYRLRETGGGAGALFLLFTPPHTHTPIHEDEAKIVGAETRARVCV